VDPVVHARLRATSGGRTVLTTPSATTRTTNLSGTLPAARPGDHPRPTRASAREPDQAVLNQPIGGSRFNTQLTQEIQVCCTFPDSWATARTRQRPPQWSDAQFHQEDLLRDDHGGRNVLELEPGQRFLRSILVPVPTQSPQPVAFRVRLLVQACPKMARKQRPSKSWSTEVVVT
jgi:hypothetical protein